MTRLGISGHQAMPPEAYRFVEAQMRQLIGAFREPITGYTSLAAGSDQLFARLILEAGGSIVAVIPSIGYEATFTDSTSRGAYDTFLAAAVEVITVTTPATGQPFPEPTEAAFMEAGLTVLANCDHLIAIWDGEPARGLGGTADVVIAAEKTGKLYTRIWPHGVRR
jgi:hypothetical protein